uniref:DUF4166 domain-containing protein n=1 Tax=uncultured Thiotrichaceae bacterium TaxID=298394 RepID=A0A6S6TGI9_9GAMM|nr:MAG: Unknown protein [uncultured Thiotrichaceae bacterium]
MDNISLMQQALGEQWQQLPEGLQRHYANDAHGQNDERGVLTIKYPKWMQWPLNGFRLMGALLNQQGERVPTTVVRRMGKGVQHWQRMVSYDNGRQVEFSSSVVYAGGNELIEYTNALLGLRMQVAVDNGQLRYESHGYVLKLGKLTLGIPEWLALGHASIVESALSDHSFAMDFRLVHPLFGEIFSYAGEFEVL